MRVAIVAGPYIPVPPLKYGGTEKVIYHTIKGLQELGHEVILFAPADSKVPCELVPIVDKHIFFPTKSGDVASFKKNLAKINKSTEAKIKKIIGSVDIVHSHGFDLINFQNYPNLTTIHGPIQLDQLAYYKKRQSLYYASISKNQQGALPDLQYVGVVYNGEDPKDFPIVTKPKDYVSFIGRFDREKNPHLAIQLAINLGIKIKVAGKIDYQGEGYFESEVAKYFSNPLVEYLGELDHKQTIEVLSNAKCNLHPTGFREPFGLTILEAAYAGTPTLAIERGSMPELIEEGRTGMLVEDFVEGYHQIEDCFKMDRQYIANRSRQLFNYKVMAKQYVQAYQRVLDIFKVKAHHEKTIKNLTKKTKKELTDIWTQEQLKI